MSVKTADETVLSTIIPTYRRDTDLSECIDSLVIQTRLPAEIIVIDNANSASTREVVSLKQEEFGEKIHFRYIQNGERNSPTIARNIGIRESSGTILLFLDDDVILEQEFIENTLNVFSMYPVAIGVQGTVINKRYPAGINLILRLFYLTHSETDKNRFLPSIQNVYAIPLTKIIRCDWLMSGCTCYKKEIFTEFLFDEKLLRYSSGDDSDLSYRINKKYPGTLFQTPHARLIHKVSMEGRHSDTQVIKLGQVYALYLFYKNFGTGFREKLIYIWSRVGLLLIQIGLFIGKPSKQGFRKAVSLIQAYQYCLRHLNLIQQGNIEFFTKDLL